MKHLLVLNLPVFPSMCTNRVSCTLLTLCTIWYAFLLLQVEVLCENCIFLRLIVGADADEGWKDYRTKDGHIYYYNGKTSQSQWEKPDDFTGTSHDLTRDEIQVSREKLDKCCHMMKPYNCAVIGKLFVV